MWVTKLLISPVKKGFFAQEQPNLARNCLFCQALPAHLLPCWWVGWWLWRAGCISQDTYLLYTVQKPYYLFFETLIFMKHTSKYSLESLSYAKIGDAAAVLLIRSVNCSSIISAILRNKIVLLQHMRFIPGKAECWNSSLARVEVVQFSTYCLSHQKEERILDA